MYFRLQQASRKGSKHAGDYSCGGDGKAVEGIDQGRDQMHGSGQWEHVDRTGALPIGPAASLPCGDRCRLSREETGGVCPDAWHQHSLVFVENPVYDKTNNIYSLYLAKTYLLQEDTLLLESDLIFEEKALRLLLDNPYPNLALVSKYESWMDGTVVKMTEDGTILDIIDKKHFQFSDCASYCKTVNIYKFSKAFSQTHYVPFLEAYCKALGNNQYYEQVLKVIALLDNPGIKAIRLENCKWYEIDDIQDFGYRRNVVREKRRRKTFVDREAVRRILEVSRAS
jgi:choline kinase